MGRILVVHVLLVAGSILSSLPSFAYTVLGGEIRYAHLQGNTCEIEAHIYTDLNTPSDLPSIVLYCGDGNGEEVPRSQIIDAFATPCGDVRLSIYTTTHELPVLDSI